jgi:hypothetical protein
VVGANETSSIWVERDLLCRCRPQRVLELEREGVRGSESGGKGHVATGLVYILVRSIHVPYMVCI